MDAPLFCPLEPAWGDIGTWVSGLASLAAVITALHIARRSDKPVARGYLGMYVFPPSIERRALMYEVSNLGTHSIYIHGCFLDFKPWVRRWIKWPSAMANDWRIPGINSQLPTVIERGETFRYGTFESAFADYLADVPLAPWLIVRSIRAGVGTPWGPIYVKISAQAKRELQRQVEEARRLKKA